MLLEDVSVPVRGFGLWKLATAYSRMARRINCFSPREGIWSMETFFGGRVR